MERSKSTFLMLRKSNDNLDDNSELGHDPTQFDGFMQWASRIFCLDFLICMKTEGSVKETKSLISAKDQCENPVYICPVYDKNRNLIEIKFNEDMYKTVEILKVLQIIVNYHPSLMTLKFKPRIDKYVIYELNKVLQASLISSIYLDGCFVPEANYYILLNEASSLKCLSLSRCLIDDTVLEIIVGNLKHLGPAAKTLRILDVSSNRITDVGARSIASALRSNRYLIHLNISGNRITDDGAIEILEALTTFQLTNTEIKEYRLRHLNFVKQNMCLETGMKRYIVECGSLLSSLKPSTRKSKKEVREPQKQEKKEEIRELTSKDPEDPFSEFITDGTVLKVPGNYTLQSLNLAYNNLSYITVKKLHAVLTIQKKCTVWPQGLIKVCIEGNRLPNKCEELNLIDLLLESKVSEGRSKKRAAKLSR